MTIDRREPDRAECMRAGDRAAFEQLVRELQPAMLRTARMYVATAAAAEDVVQDTWLAVIAGLDSFEGRGSVRSWVFSILLNRARSMGQRERRTLPFASAWRSDRAIVPPEEWVPSDRRWLCQSSARLSMVEPDHRLLAAEVLGHILELVAALPPRQREAVLARDVVGLDATDAAALAGQSPSNHRVCLHRGRLAVRTGVEAFLLADA